LPEEAKYRERLNDWEGDTIRTTPAKGCIVTLVDRKSRFLAAKGVDSVSSQKVHDAIKEVFKEKGIHSKTIVFDNGAENNTPDFNLFCRHSQSMAARL